MRGRIKTALVAVGAMAGVLVGAEAYAANSIFFVHGTGDYTQSTAVSSYWTQSSLDTMRYVNGTYYAYGVAGYQGAAKNALNSAYDVASQLETHLANNGWGPVVVVTHSNGSNPWRYIAAHGTATAAGGHSYSTLMS